MYVRMYVCANMLIHTYAFMCISMYTCTVGWEIFVQDKHWQLAVHLLINPTGLATLHSSHAGNGSEQ